MRQIWITKQGRPEALVVKEAPDLEARAHEVRIRVEGSGVDFADILGRMGIYPDLAPIPVVVGYEVCGRVDAVGAGADPGWIGPRRRRGDAFWRIFQPRFSFREASFRAPHWNVRRRGCRVSCELPAWQLVVVMGGLKRGETMLVDSAGRSTSSSGARRRC